MQDRGAEAGMCDGGAVCRRGLRRGAVSRRFPAGAVLRALQVSHLSTVYADMDGAGYVVAAGPPGREESGGGAVLCVRAVLAPHVRACDALVTAAPLPFSCEPSSAPRYLQLRVSAAAGLAPHAALRVWPDARLLAALGVPHLMPHNIRGEEYRCHICEARFADPNPLKVHLYLGCSVPERAAFWRCAGAALLRAPPAPHTALHPARLEALAAEWGAGAGAGSHACLYCGKLYSRKYGLKIHIRTHTGYRPLRCQLCARAFGDPSNLNKHVRLHAARGDPHSPALR